jgi:hypothetical protein
MSEPTPFAISRLLSDLTGQQVNVSVVINPPQSKLPQIYGVYSSVPSKVPVVVKADLRLLALLGGPCLGSPQIRRWSTHRRTLWPNRFGMRCMRCSISLRPS